ncbi:hypothetical protein B0H67DRAFT_599133 [Lasiosphaeris hirsuta]|uniref:Heterokaryon incompatibility domain-containing protein n=1 Tax=Lasiosphaeris hirsuta TaxID=260670 RepID=A0AA40ANU9_9PEZI|nr:hypothetical protein B0H67DRAFT_599133 [Lasiosphaeris hirsuta]
MRLINTESLDFGEYIGNKVPEYAILSHTWGRWRAQVPDLDTAPGSPRALCEEAKKHLLQHIWIDTVCINKESSAELSEAINSMFAWYRRAAVCFAWFTRGWTLQELLAPHQVLFFNSQWTLFGTKKSLHGEITRITNIENFYLQIPEFVTQASIAKHTAYCLMGIFEINMPLLYGEGPRAFIHASPRRNYQAKQRP